MCLCFTVLWALWAYQLTNNHSLPPNTTSPSPGSPEFWANAVSHAVSHAGVAHQHNWNAHDATVFQHMLICVWGGRGPRFRHISRPAVSLVTHVCLSVPTTDTNTHALIELGWGIDKTWCTQLPPTDNVISYSSCIPVCLCVKLKCRVCCCASFFTSIIFKTELELYFQAGRLELCFNNEFLSTSEFLMFEKLDQ